MPSSHLDSTRRFSNRVDHYVRYRPHYPPGVLDILRAGIGLTPQAVVADIGAGTGISTELFLRHGNPVHAVEPNREMRAAAERLLGAYPGFHSVDGTAEATTLADGTADCVVAAQAFHWFNPEKARLEFRRILRRERWVVLLWNTRREDTTPFLRAYEKLLRTHGTDYAQVQHRHVNRAKLAAFYAAEFQARTLPNTQKFGYEALEGRLLSSSYTPAKGEPGHEPMLAELRRIFEEHEQDGQVRFDYETEVFYGRM